MYFDLEEVFGRAVDLLEGLLARVGHGLHCGGFGVAVAVAIAIVVVVGLILD